MSFFFGGGVDAATDCTLKRDVGYVRDLGFVIVDMAIVQIGMCADMDALGREGTYSMNGIVCR